MRDALERNLPGKAARAVAVVEEAAWRLVQALHQCLFEQAHELVTTTRTEADMKRRPPTRPGTCRLPPNGTKPNRSGLTFTTDARGSALPTVLALLQMCAVLTIVSVEASPHRNDQAQVCMRARCSPHVPAPTRSQSENGALCRSGLPSFGRCLAVAMIRPDHASQAYHVVFDARITTASLDAVKRFLARCAT